jgi:hypothetical protein
LQVGDEDLAATPFSQLAGRPLVVEEKLDGANAALSFADDGTLQLQSRGHYLTGGDRERHFALFKTWAAAHQVPLRRRLGTRYIVYGEWLFAKHTVFYDRLPHYFLEFDVLDLQTRTFLATPQRRELLDELPIVPVPVLHAGPIARLPQLTALLGRSLYKRDDWRDRLRATALERGLDPERVQRETDAHDDAEGLYVKYEEDGRVVGRYKWIRASFSTSVVDSGTHWLNRPIIPNALADGVDLFAS